MIGSDIMKRILSIVLSVLMLISIIFGIEADVFAAQVGWEYCDICQKQVSYYYYAGPAPPPPCTEDVYIGLHCGHSVFVRSARECNYSYATLDWSGERIQYQCTGCGSYYFELLSEHKCVRFSNASDIEPTCENQGRQGGKMCIGCKTVYEATYTPALGHQMVRRNDGKRPTCTEIGYDSSYVCMRKVGVSGKICGHIEEGGVIPALGHNVVIDEKVAPEGCKPGLTEGSHCSACGEVYVVQEVIPSSAEHTAVIDNAVAPSMCKPGLTEGSHCSVCEKVLVAPEIVPSKYHRYTKIIIKKETCTENGESQLACMNCDYEEIKTIPATGHTPEIIGKKSATYFEKGYSGDKVCKDCDVVITKGKATPKLKLKTPKATIKGGKKILSVKYTKVKGANGFQLKYKLDKKSITKTFNTKKTATKTIRNLEKGTYKIYVRTFTKQGSKKVYSDWSKVKKVKVK